MPGWWTPQDADEKLDSSGVVWNMGQLTPQTKRHLNKVADRHAACWPDFWQGTCRKTCWLRRDHPLALFMREGTYEQP